MPKLTRASGNGTAEFATESAMVIAGSRTGRLVQLLTGERYTVTTTNQGQGILLSSGNYANRVGESGAVDVESFNGRAGAVVPVAGDYPPAFIGAVSIGGATLTGDLISSNGFSLNATSLSVSQATKDNTPNTLVKREFDGSTEFGFVVVSAAPTDDSHLANKAYVDAQGGGGNFVPVTGGTFTGPVVFQQQAASDFTPTQPSHLTRKGYVDGLISPLMPKAGGSFTGSVTFQVNSGTTQTPTNNDHYTRKGYVDGLISPLMPKSGGTFTGVVIFNATAATDVTPTQPSHITRKGYVDSLLNAAADAIDANGGNTTALRALL